MENTAIEQHFKQAAPFWSDVYEQAHVYALVHQDRRGTVLALVDRLRLKAGANALDIGCGTGAISVPLAARGLNVNAVDAVPEMVALTKRRASECQALGNLEVAIGDIHNLEFRDKCFDLVLAIGVLPWLSGERNALREIRRVIKPGGYVVVNVDNRWGLHRILDPATNFCLAGLRVGIGHVLRFLRLRNKKRGIPTTLSSRKRFNRLLDEHEFEILEGKTIGFGPFTVFGREIFPNRLGLKVHRILQNLCDRNVPIVRWLGGQYLVLAQKRNPAA